MTYQPQLIHLSVSDALQSAFVSSFRFPMPIERAAVWQLYQVTAKGQQEVEFSSPKVNVMFE